MYNNIKMQLQIRIAQLNEEYYDLDKIFDIAEPVGNIEFIAFEDKSKKSPHSTEDFAVPDNFMNCIQFNISTWNLMLFKNGTTAVVLYPPSDETYEKNMLEVFDILKQAGYTPYFLEDQCVWL